MESAIVPNSEANKIQSRITAVQLSAILELLIEKGVFTREEFDKMAQKKIEEKNLLESLITTRIGKPIIIFEKKVKQTRIKKHIHENEN